MHDYSSIINAVIFLKEKKFDFAYENIKLLNDNYLQQFYEFLEDDKSGPIWIGTIQLISLIFFILIIFDIQ